MTSYENNSENFPSYLHLPESLPEVIPPKISQYLARSTALLYKYGAAKILANDYHNKQYLVESDVTVGSEYYYDESYFFEADSFREFHESKLPLTALAQRHKEDLIFGLVKVDAFGEILCGYCVDMFCIYPNSRNTVNAYISKKHGLSQQIIDTTIALVSEQLKIGWSPVYDLKESL